ncbi:hypothetical protein B0H12DRAFT_1243101 [Mycena haematopus]|nr:hypothetical protein B0H12DRAFT_1243101 [Mycena haematopus]
MGHPGRSVPKGVVDSQEMVEFYNSLAGLPWSDYAPNSAYTRISVFYARLAADDSHFRYEHAPARHSPRSAAQRGILAGRLLDEFPMCSRALCMGQALLSMLDAGVPACKGESGQASKDAGILLIASTQLVTTMLKEQDPRYQEYLERKKDGTAYSAATEKKLNEERQRQKAKKEKKRKNKKW